MHLAARHDDDGGEQRPEGAAEIAADLKDGLGEAVFSARSQTREPGGLGVEDG